MDFGRALCVAAHVIEAFGEAADFAMQIAESRVAGTARAGGGVGGFFDAVGNQLEPAKDPDRIL